MTAKLRAFIDMPVEIARDIVEPRPP